MTTIFRKLEIKNSLTNIKKLEKFLKSHKQDDVIETTIQKLLALKMNQLDQEMKELNVDLQQFEKKYNYLSGEF